MRHWMNFLTASIAVITLVTTAHADNWPSFRGADRTAVAPDTDLLKEWPEGGPKLLWEASGAGRGYASVAIVDGKIYTLGDGLSTADGDKDEYLTCFDDKTGEQVWKTKTGEAWNDGKEDWQGSRSTPTVEGEHVYVITPHGKLVACKTDGTLLWTKDLKADFQGTKADSWGYSESVLIDGENLICTPGSHMNTMVALNKVTGETIWTCSRENDRGAGHASIVISEVGGTRVYVQTTGQGAMGVRATDGKLLWTYDIEKTTAVIPSPIVRDDLVFITAGYKRGGALLKQIPKEDGEVDIEEVYSLNTQLANKHGGVVLVGDFIYGDSDSSGIPFCADLLTGEIQWKERGEGGGSVCVAVADGHLYLRYQNGMMVLAEADSADYTVTGKFQIPGSGSIPSWSHPVIVDGKLYLREGDKIFCYSLKG